MDDATKILAMTECLILWDYLAETGEESKFVAMARLFNSGRLAQDSYGELNCPLCERLWFGGPNGFLAKCEAAGNPFDTWRLSKISSERKAAAKKVLELLESIEF